MNLKVLMSLLSWWLFCFYLEVFVVIFLLCEEKGWRKCGKGIHGNICEFQAQSKNSMIRWLFFDGLNPTLGIRIQRSARIDLFLVLWLVSQVWASMSSLLKALWNCLLSRNFERSISLLFSLWFCLLFGRYHLWRGERGYVRIATRIEDTLWQFCPKKHHSENLIASYKPLVEL